MISSVNIQDFINEGQQAGWLVKTGHTNAIRIGGKTEDREILEVRIDRLHYNLDNGRIATFVSRYIATRGQLPSDPDAADDLIERMIEEGNPQRLRRTKLDIKAKGQQEPAVVLSNGTVVDGNRRFTCLRQLSREEGTPRLMRCYVLPDTYDRKDIKGLELEIQFGRDERLNYDPIDRLQDLDRCVNGGIMSAREYAAFASEKLSEVKKDLAVVDLIKEFLEFVDAPDEFYIAKDLQVEGPLNSLSTKLSKCRNAEEAQGLKSVVFASIATQTVGDRTRDIRDLMDDFLASCKRRDEFATEQLDLAERVADKLCGREEGVKVTTEFIRDHIAADEQLKEEQKASRERARQKAEYSGAKQQQTQLVEQALAKLNDVEAPILKALPASQLRELDRSLRQVASLTERLLERVGQLLEEQG